MITLSWVEHYFEISDISHRIAGQNPFLHCTSNQNKSVSDWSKELKLSSKMIILSGVKPSFNVLVHQAVELIDQKLANFTI